MRYNLRNRKESEILICIVYTICISITAALPPKVEQRESLWFYFLFLTLSLFFGSIAELAKEERRYKIFFWLSIFVLASPMALRAQTGTDDPAYREIYYIVSKGLVQSRQMIGTEIGYSILNRIVYIVAGEDYNIAQLIICYLSFFFWGGAFQKFRDLCNVPSLLFFLFINYYFHIMSAGLVRIFLSIPIALIGISYIPRHNLKKFLFFIFASSTIHISALILIILSPLAKKERLSFGWINYIIESAVFIPSLFVLIAKVLVPIMHSRYAQYGVINTIKIDLGCFDKIPYFIAGLYGIRYVKRDQVEHYILGLILLSFSIIFGIAETIVPIGRVSFYSNTGIILVNSALVKARDRNFLRLAISIFLIVYSFVYFSFTCIINQYIFNRMVPYISFNFIF